MKIVLEKPLAFQGIGRKDTQEDFGVMDWPGGRFFILCDGMGGHEKGEVASQTVCEALKKYFTETPPENYAISQEYFDKAVKSAYEQLDAQDKNSGTEKKMGTTLTCVYFGDNAALVAHIGDSRVYQIRPSEYTKDNYLNVVKIETKDHSLVRQLIDVGEITEEEAKNHPKRNIITKCMQPHEDYDMPDYDSCDIKAGDYFFLCSDGILENITAEILCGVLSETISDEEKKEKLKSYCDDKTRDNYTCILLHVKSGELPDINGNMSKIKIEQPEHIVQPEHKLESECDSHTSIFDWIKQNFNTVLISVAAVICVFLLFSQFKTCFDEPNSKSDNKKIKPEKEDPKKRKESALDEILKKYRDYDRKNLGYGMVQYENKKTGELVLVNTNYPKTFNLIDSDGKITLSATELKDKNIKPDDFKIYAFTCDSIAKDTVAEIELILKKATQQASADVQKWTINSKFKTLKK